MNQGLSAYCQKYGLIFHDYKGYYRDVKDMINYQLKLEKRIFEWFICHLDLRQTFIKGKIFFDDISFVTTLQPEKCSCQN